MTAPDRPDFRARLARGIVRGYPPAWRERYADEVLDVLDQHRVTLRTVAAPCCRGCAPTRVPSTT